MKGANQQKKYNQQVQNKTNQPTNQQSTFDPNPQSNQHMYPNPQSNQLMYPNSQSNQHMYPNPQTPINRDQHQKQTYAQALLNLLPHSLPSNLQNQLGFPIQIYQPSHINYQNQGFPIWPQNQQ